MYAPEARAQRRAPVCWDQTKKMMRENKRVRPDACVHEDRIWSGCYVATSFRPRRRRGPAAEARRYRTLSTYTHTHTHTWLRYHPSDTTLGQVLTVHRGTRGQGRRVLTLVTNAVG